jgi:hypothetical protein
LILREEHTEGVLEQGAENTVTEEDWSGWRNLHNEILHNLYSSPN